MQAVIININTMDPQSLNQPDLHMPPPNVEQDGLITEPEQDTAESHPQFSDATDTVLVDPRDNSSHMARQVIDAPTVSQDNSTGVSSDDDDNSLDEEWVLKAKAIVEQTKADPYQQSREISKVKASYLKTHYNKDIKVADDQSS